MRTWRVQRGREGDLPPPRGKPPFVSATAGDAVLGAVGGAIRLLPEHWRDIPRDCALVRCVHEGGEVEVVCLMQVKNPRS